MPRNTPLTDGILIVLGVGLCLPPAKDVHGDSIMNFVIHGNEKACARRTANLSLNYGKDDWLCVVTDRLMTK